eukprot:753656-Hanusia_phi.AAC.21
MKGWVKKSEYSERWGGGCPGQGRRDTIVVEKTEQGGGEGPCQSAVACRCAVRTVAGGTEEEKSLTFSPSS